MPKIEKDTFLDVSIAFYQLRNFLISQGAQILTSWEPTNISCKHGSLASLQNVDKKISIDITPHMAGSKVSIRYVVGPMTRLILVVIWGIASIMFLFSFIFSALVAIVSLIVLTLTFALYALYSSKVGKFAKDLIRILEPPPPPPPL